MNLPPKATDVPRIVITREALRDGSPMAGIRARAAAGLPVRSEAEFDASLDAVLVGHDPREDVSLFGYGSLMWNPAITT